MVSPNQPGFSAGKSGELRLRDLLLPYGLAHLLELTDVVDRIHLLHVLGNNVRKAKGRQARFGELGVAPHVGEPLGLHRPRGRGRQAAGWPGR
jgi:hypothetical protein